MVDVSRGEHCFQKSKGGRKCRTCSDAKRNLLGLFLLDSYSEALAYVHSHAHVCLTADVVVDSEDNRLS